MYDRYKKLKEKMSVEDFLNQEIGLIKGAPYFIDKTLEVLDTIKMPDDRIIWWVGMFCNYHNHDDFTYGNLQKTRAHFKNLARRFLDENDTQSFLNWERNWSIITIICKKFELDYSELLDNNFIEI